MLARLERELPSGDGWVYEPKWDGFRCLVFRDGTDVDLRSRNDRPMARYFPEVVAAVRTLPHDSVVLDAELLIPTATGTDFPALLARLHPARSRVAALAEQTPAVAAAFDLLAVSGDDLREAPFEERRGHLESLLEPVPAQPPSVALTPQAGAAGDATGWLDADPGSGIDGVIARRCTGRYEEGRRVLVKVKRRRTVDCVVAGLRVYDRDRGAVSSLLLGLYDAGGTLHHVGVAAGFAARDRRALLQELAPLVTELPGHPWEQGFGLEGGAIGRLKGTAGRWTPDLPRDWVPLRPERVAEVSYDHLVGHRFRHPGRFVHWRPDRSPASCTLEQLWAGR